MLGSGFWSAMTIFGIPTALLKDLGLAGAVATVVSALVTAILATYLKKRADREIEKLKSELGHENKVKSARVDYEYEARKRLYKEVEPILFAAQLVAKSLSGRLASFAERIRDGHITLDQSRNWLTIDSYFQQSTAYWIFLPMTYYRHLTRRISQFDLSLDPAIGKKFMILGVFQSIPVADFELAGMPAAKIVYEPYGEAATAGRDSDPARYCFQGIIRGDVERFTSMMMVENDHMTPLEWFQFEREVAQEGSDLNKAYKPVRNILLNFHPVTHPVVWRAMIAYVLLSDFFNDARDYTLDEFDALAPASAWTQFDYRRPSDAIAEAIPRGHFEAARTYMRKKLAERFKTLDSLRDRAYAA